MKLFDNFKAVKFSQENLIFVTNNGYLHYIYNPKYNYWRKHIGNDSITVDKYTDVSKEELIDAMQGVFPQKETDFMRMCPPGQLCIRDMLDLLKEDYMNYMSNNAIYHAVHGFLLESNICYKSYLEVKKFWIMLLRLNKVIEKLLIKKCVFVVLKDFINKR